jgi:hypothetical protein
MLKPMKKTVYLLTIIYIGLVIVEFQVLKATSMKMTAFWDVAPCNLVELG